MVKVCGGLGEVFTGVGDGIWGEDLRGSGEVCGGWSGEGGETKELEKGIAAEFCKGMIADLDKGGTSDKSIELEKGITAEFVKGISAELGKEVFGKETELGKGLEFGTVFEEELDETGEGVGMEGRDGNSSPTSESNTLRLEKEWGGCGFSGGGGGIGAIISSSSMMTRP